MNVLVCVKRVPATAGKINLTEDEREIDTRYLGFTVSPHEECAVEEAVRLVEAHGGSSTVVTLGPPEALDQLQSALAVGVNRAIHLESGGVDWDPGATAGALAEAIRAERDAGREYDLLLFGNEAADTGDYQVPIRVSHGLGLPCVTGIKRLEVTGGRVVVKREASGGWEVFEVPLPAVIAVREGLNLPRFPSVPGRIRARKAPVQRLEPRRIANGLDKVRLIVPRGSDKRVEILGTGPDAATRAAALIRELGLVAR
jgi:electron transfer flavoprotein beta subunit